MAIFEGICHGLQYRIHEIEDKELGSYFDILLIIGNKQSREMASTLIEAFYKLAARIRAWDLDQKDILMTPEQARKRIGEWKAAWELLNSLSENERNSEQAKIATMTILQAAIDLGNAGYRINEDETDWYHPGEEN